MQNLLVTGGCGFIGANFIHFLLGESDFRGRVINVDALTYAGNRDNVDGIARTHPDRYVFEKADIGDAAAVARIFDRYEVDAVCHFAAESHVDRSIAGPAPFIATNIHGTFTLLETARQRKGRIARFHHISTDEVYGSLGPREPAFTEQTPYRPNSPYAASKAASDHLVRAYARTYGLDVTISNCSNNYGPYQHPEKLIPLMIHNALRGGPLPVYGDGKNVRDWLYVADHCRAVWRILTAGRSGETYNIGGGCEMNNLEVVETICDLLEEMMPDPARPPCRERIAFVQDRPGHDRRYAVDFTRIRDRLGWEPVEDFASGLKKTIRWYLDHEVWVERIRSGEYRRWVARQYDERPPAPSTNTEP